MFAESETRRYKPLNLTSDAPSLEVSTDTSRKLRILDCNLLSHQMFDQPQAPSAMPNPAINPLQAPEHLNCSSPLVEEQVDEPVGWDEGVTSTYWGLTAASLLTLQTRGLHTNLHPPHQKKTLTSLYHLAAAAGPYSKWGKRKILLFLCKPEICLARDGEYELHTQSAGYPHMVRTQRS